VAPTARPQPCVAGSSICRGFGRTGGKPVLDLFGMVGVRREDEAGEGADQSCCDINSSCDLVWNVS
jgi:hypothetical protein